MGLSFDECKIDWLIFFLLLQKTAKCHTDFNIYLIDLCFHSLYFYLKFKK